MPQHPSIPTVIRWLIVPLAFAVMAAGATFLLLRPAPLHPAATPATLVTPTPAVAAQPKQHAPHPNRTNSDLSGSNLAGSASADSDLVVTLKPGQKPTTRDASLAKRVDQIFASQGLETYSELRPNGTVEVTGSFDDLEEVQRVINMPALRDLPGLVRISVINIGVTATIAPAHIDRSRITGFKPGDNPYLVSGDNVLYYPYSELPDGATLIDISTTSYSIRRNDQMITISTAGLEQLDEALLEQLNRDTAALRIAPPSQQRSSAYDELIIEAAKAYRLEPALIKAVIHTESNFNPYAVSHAGAQGLMQLMPVTATRFGVADPFNASANVLGGSAFLALLLDKYDGDLELTLAGYNAGEGNVAKYGGVPPFAETRNYIRKVSYLLERYRGVSEW